MIAEGNSGINCEAKETAGAFKYVCFKKNNVGMDDDKCAGISIRRQHSHTGKLKMKSCSSGCEFWRVLMRDARSNGGPVDRLMMVDKWMDG